MIKTFPASIDLLYEMLCFIRDHALATGFDESQISKIELATEEALVNIISYGYPQNKGSIEINCNINRPGRIEIIIKDDGIPYNPLQNADSPKPSPSLDSHKLGGYGIFFMLNVMDEVKYKRVNNYNILTLIKALESQG